MTPPIKQQVLEGLTEFTEHEEMIIDLTLAKVEEMIESFTTMDRGNIIFKGGVTPEELLAKIKGGTR